MKVQINLELNDVLRMAWLHPQSEVAMAICPELTERARVEEWNPQHFIREAVPRIAPWATRVLGGVDGHLLDATVQNFIARMAERRPDLFFDESRGSRSAHMAGVLWKVFRETCREERLSLHDGWADEREDTTQERPLAALEQRERCEVAQRLLQELSPKQHEALANVYTNGTVSGATPRSVIYLRRHRAIRTLQRRAESLGLRSLSCPYERGKTRRLRRRVSRRNYPPRCSGLQSPLREDPVREKLALNNQGGTDMPVEQWAIDEKNARALQTLFESLPKALQERMDLLGAVRDVFEREFAQRAKPRRASATAGRVEGTPSS